MRIGLEIARAWSRYGGPMSFDQFRADYMVEEARHLFGCDSHVYRVLVHQRDSVFADAWRDRISAAARPRHTNCGCTTGDDMKKVKHRKPNKARTLNHCAIGETVIPGKNIDRTWLAGEKEAVAHATALLRRKVDSGDDRTKKLLVVRVVRVVEIKETPVVSRVPRKGEFDDRSLVDMLSDVPRFRVGGCR